MHTYKTCINFSISQQLFIFILTASYIFLQFLISPYSLYTALILSYNPSYFLTTYSCILNRTIILFNKVLFQQAKTKTKTCTRLSPQSHILGNLLSCPYIVDTPLNQQWISLPPLSYLSIIPTKSSHDNIFHN